MNFPKLKKIYVKGIGVVEIRPYLTSNEIDSILAKIQTISEFSLRKMTMYAIVMSICTNIEDFAQEDVNIDVVETYYLNGVFNRITKHIKGFDILIDGYNKLPITDIYMQFNNALQEFTTQFKNVNVDDSIKKLEDELNKLHDVAKEREEILNG